MKRLIFIVSVLVVFTQTVFAQDCACRPSICLGGGAGLGLMHSDTGCVVVGHGLQARTISGRMTWLVNAKEPEMLRHKKTAQAILAYRKIVHTKSDTPARREKLINQVAGFIRGGD